MNKAVRFALAAAALLSLSSCSVVVPPGYEGIKVNNTGSRRGVEDYPIMTGRVFYNLVSEDVYQYPTFKHNYVWAKVGEGGGEGKDESISFNSSEGTNLNADVGTVLNVQPGATPRLFVTYRASMNALIDGPVRNEVRRFLNVRAGAMNAMQIVGEQKGALLDSVTVDMRRSAIGKYVDFETISFTSNIRMPEGVQQSINAVNQARARIESARADSLSAVVRAAGEAAANQKVAASLTAELVNYYGVQKWDGKLPSVTGGAIPMINVQGGNR